MSILALMCGLPGAGKTTVANSLKENFSSVRQPTFVLSIDDFYKGDYSNPEETWKKFYQNIECLEKSGVDCIIDTDSRTVAYRDEILKLFPNFDIHILIYIDADKDLRIKNNNCRERVVPLEKMIFMETELEIPTPLTDSNWDYIMYYKNIDNEFDLIGTFQKAKGERTILEL